MPHVCVCARIRHQPQIKVRPHSAGKERDSESGNDYFGARYYASSTGRFISPDPSGLGGGGNTPIQTIPGGAWSEAGDIFACSTTNLGPIEVPSVEVKPRGWYNGKYAKFPFLRKPSFTGIDISAKLETCTARVTLNISDSRNLGGKKVVVTVNCHGDSQVNLRGNKSYDARLMSVR